MSKPGFAVIGQPLPKLDAWAKVTGGTCYADDLVLPRLAYGKILRSPHAHARILGIDTARARAVPGVLAVITGRDLPRVKFGILPVSQDEEALCTERVRMVGDAVGIAFPHGHMVQPVTPPPDFDPHQVTEHLERIALRDPAFLGFAHIGPDRDPQNTLAMAAERLWDWVDWVERAAADGGQDLAPAMRAWVLDGYRRDGYSPDTIATYDRNTFWPMQASGIRRWLSGRS